MNEWRPIDELTPEMRKTAWRIAGKKGSVEKVHHPSNMHELYPGRIDYFSIIEEPTMPFKPEIGKIYCFYDYDDGGDIDRSLISVLDYIKSEELRKYVSKLGSSWKYCRPLTESEKELIG